MLLWFPLKMLCTSCLTGSPASSGLHQVGRAACSGLEPKPGSVTASLRQVTFRKASYSLGLLFFCLKLLTWMILTFLFVHLFPPDTNAPAFKQTSASQVISRPEWPKSNDNHCISSGTLHVFSSPRQRKACFVLWASQPPKESLSFFFFFFLVSFGSQGLWFLWQQLDMRSFQIFKVSAIRVWTGHKRLRVYLVPQKVEKGQKVRCSSIFRTQTRLKLHHSGKTGNFHIPRTSPRDAGITGLSAARWLFWAHSGYQGSQHLWSFLSHLRTPFSWT